MTLEQARAREAKLRAAYLEGKSDQHPHGKSGGSEIMTTTDMWDTAPQEWRFSEWGSLAGFA